MAGLISICLFSLVFCTLGQRAGCLFTTSIAIATFLASTWVLHLVDWQLIPAFCSLMPVLFLVLKLIPMYPVGSQTASPPRWDLPARIIVTTSFVLVITGLAGILGPQVSGLLSPFPILSTVFAVFTLIMQGPKVMSNLLRGLALGTLGSGAFFLVIGGLLPRLGVVAAYLSASLMAVLINMAFIWALQKLRQRRPHVAE